MMTTGILVCLVLILLLSCPSALAAAGLARRAEVKKRPAIALVVSGTSDPVARKVFDYVDVAARKRYPGYDIRWAYTSEFILAKLARQGVEVASLPEVVASLKRDGHASAVFQSLHVVPGQEYRTIREVDTSGLRIAIGKALLADDDDIGAVVEALDGEIEDDGVSVVICHGNQRYPEFNRQLLAFAEKIESRRSNVFVCSLSGQPGTDKLSQAKRAAIRLGKAKFIPLMVAAGVHVVEDTLGDAAESWKTILGASTSTCAQPLGYRDRVLAVYFRHLDETLRELNQPEQPEDFDG